MRIASLIGLLIAHLFTVEAQIKFYGDLEPVSAVNSVSGENYIFFDFDNSSIYFTREKHVENEGGTRDRGDIWMSKHDSAWSKPTLHAVNDGSFQSPIGFTPDRSYFLFNKVWFDKGLYYGGVYAVDQNDLKKPFEVNIPYFKNKSPLQTGAISADGKYLVLSLETNVGYGVDDLFVCQLGTDGSWSSPKNLGNTVNSSLQELTPFLAADNKTLFFASNGHGGEGSFDIFKSVRLDDTWLQWSAPENIGTSVNTSGAETSFVFSNDSEYAYFVSTQNSDGYGDIKRIKVQSDFEEVVENDEAVYTKAEEDVLDRLSVSFRLMDAASNDYVKGEALLVGNGDTVRYQGNGDGLVVLNDVEGTISVEFKARGYFSARYQFVVDSLMLDEEPMPILLSSLEEGSVIRLDHVLFYRGTANFIEGSEDELDLVVEMMKENKEVEIFLKGHTDNQGNPVMNIQLSQERVLAVTDYLVSNGVDESRIDGKGFGGEQPIASNAQEATRKLNRRVEFEVKKNN